jgi:O-antigen/teichoic acid export membrane protein
MESLKKMWRVGLSVFSTSSLNTFFLYIYSFVIGAFYNLTSLGVYTQADKWSKMGSASISQVLTASFVPVLSRVQDDGPNFRRYMTRVNRFTGFILFPVMIGIAAIGGPLFHLLFGTKWDDAVPLFQILTIRGIFVVLISLYNNYLLALGYGKRMVSVEVVKDVMIFVAILATVWMHSVEMLVWGQLAASLITWAVVIGITCRATGYRTVDMLRDLAPFALIAILMGVAALFMLPVTASPILQLILMVCVGIIVYVALARLFRLPELTEAIAYFRRKSN